MTMKLLDTIKEFISHSPLQSGSDKSPLGRISLIAVTLSIVLYVLTYNISYRYHQEVVPYGDPMGYSKMLMMQIDAGQENYFSSIESVFTSKQWYWIYKLPVALLAPILSREPYSLCLVNYLFLALATFSLCRVATRFKLNFNSTLLLSLSLWLYPWIYGLRHEMGLFALSLETSFYWILISMVSHLIIYALEPKSYKNAVIAGIFTGLAIWGRGNSFLYVVIVLTFPLGLILTRIIKSPSRSKPLLYPLTAYALLSGVLAAVFYVKYWKGLLAYYGEQAKAIEFESGLLGLIFNKPEIALKGWEWISCNFPGIIVFRVPFSFWSQFSTVLSHIFILFCLFLAVFNWKKKRTKRNRYLAVIAMTGATLFYGNLLMGLVLLFQNHGTDRIHVYFPFRLMLIGIALNVFGLLVQFISKEKIRKFVAKPIIIPAACVFLLIYGYSLSKAFTPIQKNQTMDKAINVEHFALNLENILEEGTLAVLWWGQAYSTNSLRYYRLKAGYPPPNLFYTSYEKRSLVLNYPSDMDRRYPIKEFRKLLLRGIYKSNYIIIPEDIRMFDFMFGNPGLAQRRHLLAEILNAPDSPKFAVKMILRDFANTRLLLLKRLRRGKNPDNLDLLKLPYGDKNTVYPQRYPRAALDIYQPRMGKDIYQPPLSIPFGPKNLFDQSLAPSSFWEITDELPIWVEMQFENKKEVAGYNIKVGLTAIHRMPNAWQLQGTNDEINWITVDSRSEQTGWKGNENREYVIQNPGQYLSYRFLFTKGGQKAGKKFILRLFQIELLERGTNGKFKLIDNEDFDSLDKRFVDSVYQ